MRPVGSGNYGQRGVRREIVIDNPSAGLNYATLMFVCSKFDFVGNSVGSGFVGLPSDHDLVRSTKCSVIAKLDIRGEGDLLAKGSGSKRDARDQRQLKQH